MEEGTPHRIKEATFVINDEDESENIAIEKKKPKIEKVK